MKQDDKRSDYDLGQEIEKSLLYRGEYKEALAARGIGCLIYGGILLGSLLVGMLFAATGTPMTANSIIVILAIAFAIGLILILGS